MSDELEEQVERAITLMVEEGHQPYVMPGQTVSLTIDDEEFPAGVIITAYQSIIGRIAVESESAIQSMQARSSHNWALTVQNVMIGFFVVGFLLVMFKGWP